MRLWAYQCIAHGADAVLHFRWRSCRFGAEEYWCGVLDHDNKPRRRYQEFAREGEELRRLGGEILGTSVQIDAGVLIEYDQDCAHEAMPLGMPSPADQARLAHQELWRRKLAVGVVEASDSFEGTKLLVVPSFTIMDEDLVGRLAAFVRGGGTLLVTAWSGSRDRFNRIVPLTPPGLLADLVGATVEEYGRLEEGENALVLNGQAVPARMWYEALQARAARPIASWQGRHYAGSPGFTANRVGAGQAFYLGTYLSDKNAAAVFQAVLGGGQVRAVLENLPEPVEAARRSGGGRSLLFLLNHSDQPQTVANLPEGTDLVSGRNVDGRLTLAGKDVAILKLTP
jgi:beta-galactosidase